MLVLEVLDYGHPGSHTPDIITQDANNRFVTDAEKALWNAGTGNIANRTELAAVVSTPEVLSAYMAGHDAPGDGGGGHFNWDASDLSVEVAADPGQAVYIPPVADPTGFSGAWVRDGTTLEGAVDTLIADSATHATDIGDLQTEMTATQTGAGLAATGDYVPDAGAVHIPGATSLANADSLLDAALETVINDMDTAAVTTIRSDLAAVTAAKGASLIGVEDSGAVFTAATVEGVLAELMAAINAKIPVTVAGAALSDITDPINTTGKFAGKLVIKEASGIMIYASGNLAADVWRFVSDGTTSNTPV